MKQVARPVCAALLGVLAASCAAAPVLNPAGPVGRGDLNILQNSVELMLTIVVPTILLTIGFAWWYRPGNPRAKRLPDFAYSGKIEAVVWAVPTLTIMFLGGMIWIGAHSLDPAKPLASKEKPLEVQVVSLDWKWLFIYPEEGVASVNTLAAPVGRPIHFSLTSGSVMNTFFVPQLGSMIYTMNGMADNLWLQADKPGVYPGLSGMISGDGFPDMHFDLKAMPPADYAGWVAAAKANGPVLDAAAYGALAHQSLSKPFTFRGVQPGLFDQVVSQAIAPAPGPAQGGHKESSPGPQVSPKPLSPA